MINLTQRLCLGTVQFGLEYGIANKYGKPTFSEIKEIIKIAINNDVEFFDTAQTYGNCEEILGDVFSELKPNNLPKFITKLHPEFSFASFGSLSKSLNSSLKKLQVKSLWGILLHRTTIQKNWQDLLSSIDILKDKGIIKNFGVSVYEPDEAMYFLQQDYIDSIQIPFNILDRRLVDRGFFELAEKLNKIIFARSIYLQGLITMSFDELKAKNMEWAFEFVRVAHGFVNKYNIEIKHFAIHSILKKFSNVILVMGVDNSEQLRENILLFNKGKIDKGLIEEWWKNLPLFPDKLLNPSLWK